MNWKRIAVTAFVPVFAAAVAWIGGYDFDSHGFWQAYALIVCVFACIAVWFAPWWKDGE